MATKTDLEGYLVNGESGDPTASLSGRLENYFTMSEAKKGLPITVRVTWLARGTTSEREIVKKIVSSLPTSVPNLIDSLRAGIVQQLGAAPCDGSLRTRVSGQGGATAPDVDFTRSLVAGAGSEDPSLGLVRSELDRQRQYNAEMAAQMALFFKTMQENNATLAGLAVKQSETIATLGTARASTAPANDLSNVVGFLGLGAFMFALPWIKRQLGLPSDASVRQLGETLVKQATGLAEKPSLPLPPPGAGAPELEDRSAAAPSAQADAEARPPATAEPSPPPGAAELLRKLLSDDDFALSVGRELIKNPELTPQLQSRLQSVAMQAALSPE